MKNSSARPFRSISDAESLRGKRVLLRAALNVPLKDGAILDTYRIERALETMQFLHRAGARTVVIAHMGRTPEETLRPVYEALTGHVPIRFADTLRDIGEVADGELVLLENLRRDPREEVGDTSFAQELAALAEMYVNDAFADAHRAHASITGVPKLLPSYAGLSFVKEYDGLLPACDPAHPALAIFGGAKFDTKLPLIERFAKRYDHVFVGGALAHTFFRAQGIEIGESKVSEADLSGSPLLHDARILLPRDVVTEGPHGTTAEGLATVSSDEVIEDAGPQTLSMLAPLIARAKTVVWNGPLGDYEHEHGAGTQELARLIAAAPGVSIVGGGDTIGAIRALDLAAQFDFLSTAGGAMLQFLETETLPGIEALTQRP